MIAKKTALAVSLALLATAARADNLAGSDRFLCSAGKVTACFEDVDCFSGSPTDVNLPQFVEVDLVAKRLGSTKASGQNRSTEIKNLTREDGVIAIQGTDRGRVFSFVIDEQTGTLTAAVAMDGFTASVFGACTPMPAAR